ncbi:MAG: DNA translocase FtsK 4TM domain-containing protein [Firmicutes bacterium]|nr:DNA translocase FtsK 4TM domain-containing protein [Bacillota bacterium]
MAKTTTKKNTKTKADTKPKSNNNNRNSKGTKKPGPKSTIQQNVEKAEAKREHRATIRDEILGMVLIAFGIFLAVAIQTDAAGVLGEYIGKFLKGSFGIVAYITPYYFIIYGFLLFLRKTIHSDGKSVFYIIIIYLMFALINAGRYVGTIADGGAYGNIFDRFEEGLRLEGGGVFGTYVGGFISTWIGIPGLYIMSFVILFITILLLINTPISRFFEGFKQRRIRREIELDEMEKEEARLVDRDALQAMQYRKQLEKEKMAKQARADMQYGDDVITVNSAESQKRLMALMSSENPDGIDKKGKEEPVVKMTNSEAANSRLAAEDFNENGINENYQFPSIEFLNRGHGNSTMESEMSLRQKAMKLEDTLKSFNIDANVTNVTQGPAVTRYEVHPNSGVKVKGIKSLADDIALNMEAKSIRIEAPIPGKPAVGIEIENDRINMVTVREIIESAAFVNAKSKLTFAVGKDIAGKAIVADLKSMPHLLIAGSTGSGKSVCINSIITSILYKARPDEVKMVLIDPKVVELSNYNGIPHLLIPVVTDPAKAAAALNWAVAEMDDRYKKFAEEGARELASYNQIIEKKNAKALKAAGRNKDGSGEGTQPVTLEPKMPQVVIIIDELADLMMAAPSQVEESICRLAQKARAAGMHLIVATQRPSVDVITGVIKANIPSRIAFAVSSQVDSRTILDMGGAEKLVGKGDMLFNPLGNGKPTRVQGTFISDDEVHNVIEFVKSQGTADEAAANDVMDRISRVNTPDAEKGNRDFEDELLPDAIELVVDTGQASVSMLQRRFRIGYNRAARLIDMMEDRQIIGPSEGSKPRQVLITEEDLAIMNESLEDMK